MIIYVCSPYRGNPPYSAAQMAHNLTKVGDYCKSVVYAGHTPIAPHLYFAGFLDDIDPVDRTIGMEMGCELLRICDAVWVFGDTISEGMEMEIALAEIIGKPVEYKQQCGKDRGG